MDTMTRYTIALIQMHGVFMDPDRNARHAASGIREAAEHGAKLICLPEAFLSGYRGNRIEKMVPLAETAEGPHVKTLRRVAQDCGAYVLLPFLEQTAGGVKNSALLIDDSGNVAGLYSKTQLIPGEKGFLEPGNGFCVWNTSLGKIGCLICYDVCFPETARLLAMSGAELILVPSAWRASRYYVQWWDLNIACRALDNLVYVAAVNQVGECGREVFAGRSKVCDPVGSVIAQASDDGEEILYCDIELGRIAQERADNTVLTDLRPELYGFDRVK